MSGMDYTQYNVTARYKSEITTPKRNSRITVKDINSGKK